MLLTVFYFARWRPVLGHVGLADLKRYSAARKSTAGFPSQNSDAASIYGAGQARTELPAKHARSIPPVKHKHHHYELARPERQLRPRAVIASDIGVTPIIPLDGPDEAVLRYVLELAKRLAREDHDAEIAASQASQPATAESP
jgi:hypothetical protein